MKLYINPKRARGGSGVVGQVVAKRSNLILLDLMLPTMDGFSVLEKIRSHADPQISKVLVVVLSNLFEMKDVTVAQKYGVSHYFVKAQTDMELVLAKINELLK